MVELSNPKYTYTKRGVFYFSKKVPTDLRHHYKKPIITQSLRTKLKMAAEKASKLFSSRLEEYWLNLRFRVPPNCSLNSEAFPLIN